MIIKKMPCRSSTLLSIAFLLAVVFGFAASRSPVKADKTPTAEEIVEKTILIYGSRLALYGVQRNGIIRSLVKFFSPTGTREGKSAIKFIRKEKMKDDLSMIQLEMPDMKYSIGFDGKGNNAPDTVTSMMMMYIIPPTIISLIIAAVMWRFPLDEAKQRELRRIIEERTAAGTALGAGVGHRLEDEPELLDETRAAAKPAE